MKVRWPEPFETGDVKLFLQDFEQAAKLAGVNTDRSKFAVLRVLLKGRALAALQLARGCSENLDWSGAKEALIREFSIRADREEAMRLFHSTRLEIGEDPLTYANTLKSLLRRALPYADYTTWLQLFVQQFSDGLPTDFGERVRLAYAGKSPNIEQLISAAQEFVSQPAANIEMKNPTKEEHENTRKPAESGMEDVEIEYMSLEDLFSSDDEFIGDDLVPDGQMDMDSEEQEETNATTCVLVNDASSSIAGESTTTSKLSAPIPSYLNHRNRMLFVWFVKDSKPKSSRKPSESVPCQKSSYFAIERISISCMVKRQGEHPQIHERKRKTRYEDPKGPPFRAKDSQVSPETY